MRYYDEMPERWRVRVILYDMENMGMTKKLTIVKLALRLSTGSPYYFPSFVLERAKHYLAAGVPENDIISALEDATRKRFA